MTTFTNKDDFPAQVGTMDKVKALLTNFPEAFAHASIEKGDDVEIRRYVAELSVLDTLAAVPAKGTSFLEVGTRSNGFCRALPS